MSKMEDECFYGHGCASFGAICPVSDRPTWRDVYHYLERVGEGFEQDFANLYHAVRTTGDKVNYELGVAMQEVSSFLDGSAVTLQTMDDKGDVIAGSIVGLLAIGTLAYGARRIYKRGR